MKVMVEDSRLRIGREVERKYDKEVVSEEKIMKVKHQVEEVKPEHRKSKTIK